MILATAEGTQPESAAFQEAHPELLFALIELTRRLDAWFRERPPDVE